MARRVKTAEKVRLHAESLLTNFDTLKHCVVQGMEALEKYKEIGCLYSNGTDVPRTLLVVAKDPFTPDKPKRLLALSAGTWVYGHTIDILGFPSFQISDDGKHKPYAGYAPISLDKLASVRTLEDCLPFVSRGGKPSEYFRDILAGKIEPVPIIEGPDAESLVMCIFRISALSAMSSKAGKEISRLS